MILKDWGRLEEAMALLEKQEALCIELGNKAGLSVCYCNQASILFSEENLDDAMDLLKKKLVHIGRIEEPLSECEQPV